MPVLDENSGWFLEQEVHGAVWMAMVVTAATVLCQRRLD